MLPDTDPETGYLPPGIHQAPWGVMMARFGVPEHRAYLTGGLLAALQNLAGAGCRAILLNGSFVTDKTLPQDYDAAWETEGVNPNLLDPVLLDFSHSRSAMKAKYLGELFPAGMMAAPGVRYREFFTQDRNGLPKGIIEIDLRTIP